MARGDCLIACAGFEERAAETLRRMSDAGSSGADVALVRYLPENVENRVEEMKQAGREACRRVTEVVYDREKPVGTGEELANLAKEYSRVFVDVSGMSRLLVVQVMVGLVKARVNDVKVIYNEAGEYEPKQDVFEREYEQNLDRSPMSYLSSGIFEVAATPELSSVAMWGESIRLIAFPSFDSTQLTNLVQEVQPAYTDLVHGIPPRLQNRWRTEAIRRLNERTVAGMRETTDEFVSTLDYRATLELLCRIYKERNMFDRLVLAPTGSKMQAVAVGLFRAVVQDVQIVYPIPKEFAESGRYTRGVREMYQLDVPCGLA